MLPWACRCRAHTPRCCWRQTLVCMPLHSVRLHDSEPQVVHADLKPGNVLICRG
jgi:hypothetical protein